MYESIIIVKDKPIEKILEFLEGEDKELSNKRAWRTIEQVGNEIHIRINAHDAVSLRAMTNALLKALTIWEKMEELK